MVEKNQKKERAKKQRNLWEIHPATRMVESHKNYDRSRDRKDKKLYDYESDVLEEEEDLDDIE